MTDIFMNNFKQKKSKKNLNRILGIWRLIKPYFNFKTYIQPSWRSFINSLIIFAIIIFFRNLSIFQYVELDLLDHYFQTLPLEPVDSRVVLVAIDETDRKEFKQYPISDYELYDLLSSVQKYSPRVIGLDLYRDEWVNPDYKEGKEKLTKFLDNAANGNIIGIEKWLVGPGSPRIGPNEILAAYGQIGSNDIFVDLDNVVRRAILFPDLHQRPQLASFNYVLATQYLEKEDVTIQRDRNGDLKIGSTLIPRLDRNAGGYIDIEAQGYQLLLNYRTHPKRFDSVQVRDIISGKVNPEMLKDKVVIICTNNPSFPDIVNTPFGFDGVDNPGEIYGGWYQANATSQLISAALDNRPFLKTWSEGIEIFWIFIWIYLITNAIWNVGKKDSIWDWDLGEKMPFYQSEPKQKFFWAINLLLAVIFSLFIYILAYLLFRFAAWWIPVFPVIIGIIVGSIYSLVSVYIFKLKEAHKTANDQVIKIGNKLKTEQKKLIAQEKMASLGKILSALSHDLGNKFGPLMLFNEKAIQKTLKLKTVLKKYDKNQVFTPEDNELINNCCKRIETNLNTMETSFNQTNLIIERIRVYISQKKELKFQLLKVDLNEEIELILKSIRSGWRVSLNSDSYLEMKNINRVFWTIYDEEIEDFYLDLTSLQQVMQNLIFNALDTVQAKKRQLGQDSYQPRIDIVTENNGQDWVKITVRDNGEGIDPAIQEKIFDPLFTTKEECGIGLGLSNVRDCLESIGGRVDLPKSTLGSGSEFIIYWRKRHHDRL